MPTRRITVAEVLEAYRVTGMKPMATHFCCETANGRCGCALGALAIASGIDPNSIGDRQLQREINDWVFGRVPEKWYRIGFYRGFDGRQLDKLDATLKGIELGYADGTAVRQAVFQEQGAAQ